LYFTGGGGTGVTGFNNPMIHHVINTSLLQNTLTASEAAYTRMLTESLKALPPCTSKVFIGSASLQRKMYLKGTEFSWHHFASGSLLWKVALENVPQFTTKARKGTIFIL